MAQNSDRPSLSLGVPRSEYWRAQSEAWSTSGLTQAVFCEEHGLSLSAFRWWRWKLKREGEASRQGMRLVPVRVVEPQAPTSLPSSSSADSSSPFEVLLASGTAIRVPRDFDAATLSLLLRTLEATGC